MKKLKELLKNTGLQIPEDEGGIEILDICLNSNDVKKGSLFVALLGAKTDGHKFIDKAIENGAVAVLCEKLPERMNSDIAYILSENSHRDLALICKNFFDDPTSKFKLVGVTGTNGKTTIATLLYRLFTKLGHKSALISTVENMIGDQKFDADRTTPDSVFLNKLLAEMAEEKCEYVFMEVSSHSVAQNRISGLEFAGGIFTNLTHDHLDYHITMEDYAKAKQGFFDMLPAEAFALSNADDAHGTMMLENTKAKKNFYSLKNPSDFKCEILENSFAGLYLKIGGQEIRSKLVGEFNAYNISAIYASATLLGQDINKVAENIADLDPAEGRFEKIMSKNGAFGIVDYAHTPDAVMNVLQTIKSSKKDSAKIITVIGCGGDRDHLKRPKMAQIASQFSDILFLTSDNPRSEDPAEIIKQMRAGIPSDSRCEIFEILDRTEAIKQAVKKAYKDDVILLAGKGHEKNQELTGVKHPFDDSVELKKCLEI